MATITKVRRLANPFRKRVKSSRSKKRNPARRRKLTAKQIRYFGTKRQKAGLRSRNGAKRRKAANPKRRRTVRRNPALVVTLGALNPTRRRTNTMARKRKSVSRRRKANPARRRRRVAVVMAPRRHRRRNTTHRRRRNPAFGQKAFSAEGIKMIVGGLLGVTATKFISSMIPAGLKAPMGMFAPVVSNGIAAFAAGYLAQKMMPGSFGDGVMFGGLMQTGSTLINTVAPGLKLGEYPIALSGMGDLVPGSFVVPQNPLRLPSAPAPTNARVTINGLERSFGRAF